ncbi:aspartyl-phosphate phosphatase Spo0E family protein [Bacillus gaemokensis]|nr:aspartyl-phosphate phosphatase Spo0E family protein [Bacillus gaemokensis]KYG37503.1 transcriptional regulator [Bacillus gaemokensis]
MELNKLYILIEKRKEELIQLVNYYGFHHEKVIAFSQELDALIIHMMKQK